MDHLSNDAISQREAQVLQLIAPGKRNKEIAAELSIAADTVKMHVGNTLSNNVTDRTKLSRPHCAGESFISDDLQEFSTSPP